MIVLQNSDAGPVGGGDKHNINGYFMPSAVMATAYITSGACGFHSPRTHFRC